jgi:hypothetical protein
MVAQNRPNMLEILFLPEDCILHKDPVFDQVLERRKEFLSKICKASFGGFAESQIKKSSGYNKKINWEEAEMTRKGVLDFCYVVYNAGTVPLLDYLCHERIKGEINQENIGLSKIDHARDLYAMYDLENHNQRKGIVSSRENPNDVQLVSIPKGMNVMEYMIFNKDAYSIHCKRFAEYQQWLDNRNEDRFKMNKSHGKNYDSKNMMHTIRILLSGLGLAKNKDLKVRMDEYDYDSIISISEVLITEMDECFNKCTLPESVDKNLPRDLAYKVRVEYYKK